MRERIKKEVAEWENEEERRKNLAEDSDEDDDMEKMTGEDGVEKEEIKEEKPVDIMDEQLSEKDVLKLAKIIGDQYSLVLRQNNFKA